jgi:hypothetical protein
MDILLDEFEEKEEKYLDDILGPIFNSGWAKMDIYYHRTNDSPSSENSAWPTVRNAVSGPLLKLYDESSLSYPICDYELCARPSSNPRSPNKAGNSRPTMLRLLIMFGTGRRGQCRDAHRSRLLERSGLLPTAI